MCVQGVAVGHHFARRIRTWCPRSCSCSAQQDDEPAGKSRSSRPPRRSAVRQFPDDRNRRRDRSRTGRARSPRGGCCRRGSSRRSSSRLRCSAGSGRALHGRSGVWPTMHTNTSRIMTAFSDLEHDSRLRLPVEPRRSSTTCIAIADDVRPDLTHPVRHAGRTASAVTAPDGSVRPRRRHREFRPSGGGERQISLPRHPVRSRARHLRRRCGSDLDLPLPGARSLSRTSGFWWQAARSARSRSPPNSPNSVRPASW